MRYSLTITPTTMPPRLRVELVPTTAHPSSLRAHLSAHHWRKLAADVAGEGQYLCEVCTGRGRQHAVETHEVWLYDNEQRIQTLLRLQALCPMCHSIKHAGRTISRGYEKLVINWLKKVNVWDQPQTLWYLDAVFAQWRERSNAEWALDLTVLGEVYEIPLERLGLTSFVLTATERRQLQRDRHTRPEDIFDRNGGPL